MTLVVALIVSLPLATAMLAVVFGRSGGVLALACWAGVSLAVAALVAAVARDGALSLEMGGWPAPLGIGLRADGLACAFLAMAALVMGGVVGAARTRIIRTGGETRIGWAFWPLAMLLWAALNVVFLSRDLFNLYVGWS